MSDLMKSMAAASSGMAAQSARLRVTTENIANADTPGYRRKLMTFEQVRGDAPQVRAGKTILDRTELTEVYDPSHPLADQDGMYKSSNVNLIIEIADAREAQRSYEANLKMFDQARQMTSSLLDLISR